MKHLTVVSVSSEMAPFSKGGGLGDVTAALPKHVAGFGHRVIAVTPFWGFMKHQNLQTELAGEATIRIGEVEHHVKFKHLHLRDNLDVYFMCNEELFGRYMVNMYAHHNDAYRFYVFNRVVPVFLNQLGIVPDVIHCHDWFAGLVPNLLRSPELSGQACSRSATVFTIHNIVYQMQGNWWEVPSDKVDDGHGLPPDDPKRIRWINFTRRGILCADAINTVSVRHAKEILTPEYGQNLDRDLRKRAKDVFGIVNGIDYAVFNPQFDEHLWHRYDWNSLDRKLKNKRELQRWLHLEEDARLPLIGMVHRLTEQKGLGLITHILPVLLRLPLQIVIVGAGDRGYISTFRKAARKFPKRIGIYTPPIGSEINNELSSRVYAGSDMFLMPSRFEPCGISQLISLRYGSIPIVHETGGLSDTVKDFDPRSGYGTGFVFSRYAAEDLLIAIIRALETYKYPQVWEHLTWQAMQESYSWDLPAERYVELYRRAIRLHRQRR